jgi:hypothetical protein
MTVYLVEIYGGIYDDYYNNVIKCFSDYNLAEQYIKEKETIIKHCLELKDDYMEMFEDLEEIQYSIFNDGKYNKDEHYRSSFDNFIKVINKLPNKDIYLSKFTTDDLHKLFDYYIVYDREFSTNVANYRIIDMKVETEI